MKTRHETAQSKRPKLGLQARLVGACFGLLGLSLVLAVALLVIHGRNYQTARQSFEALRLYRQVLIAANAISAERGPTNVMLGGDFAASDEAWSTLKRYRAQSDASLQGVTDMISGNTINASSMELTRTKTELAEARSRIDKLLAAPFDVRTLPAIEDAIEGMFRAVDAIRPLINVTALYSHDRTYGLADEALIGQKLFEIRDYAGRLGSILTPYIALRQPITSADQNRMQQTLGRIQQLWELTKPYLERQPELAADIANVQTVFFGNGLDLVDHLTKEARTGEFSLSTRSMTESLVPTFSPLEAIRLAYLDFMLRRSGDSLHSALMWFLVVGVLAVVIIFIDIVLVVGMQRMIFRPLLEARDSIVALSEESDGHGASASPGQLSEIGEVFRALEILKIKLLERERLTEQLKLQATTDSLTGLLNRRTLDEIGGGGRSFASLPVEVGLILLDIDRFKSINDTYGHAIGDQVLKAVAAILHERFRSGDLVARFGGEEFAIILPGAGLAQLESIAEALRSQIAERPTHLGHSTPIMVTASFGVAAGCRGAASWTALLEKADKALYAAKLGGRNRVCVADAI